ncbi:hypothetical protein KY359_03670 [Candidatus Woesearchaeota archaeon]|nr:hypothetical protein [Candidatus Woesearchaeota archaeon]
MGKSGRVGREFWFYRQRQGIKEVISFKTAKIVLQNHEPSMNPTSEELAKIVMVRIGLDPRKSGATDKMYRTLTELYERSKEAHREKRPERAVMTVEEMGAFAGITRQTMYDYLRRWLDLNMIVKTSYIVENKVVIGYKLNGATLEASFEKAQQQISNNMELTMKYIRELQKRIKNEKISQTQKERSGLDAAEAPDQPDLAAAPLPPPSEVIG